MLKSSVKLGYTSKQAESESLFELALKSTRHRRQELPTSFKLWLYPSWRCAEVPLAPYALTPNVVTDMRRNQLRVVTSACKDKPKFITISSV